MARRARSGRAARLTARLAFADPAINRVADWGDRHPWVWFPIGPPEPRRPLGTREHVWIALTSLAGSAFFEAAAAARGQLASGRQLQLERAFSVIFGSLLWVIATGAWERRAVSLRAWWRR